MKFQEIAVILLANLVTGQNNNIFRVIPFDKRKVLINRIGRSLIPIRFVRLLIGRKHMHAPIKSVQIPRLSVPHILIQHKRLILCQNTYRVDS